MLDFSSLFSVFESSDSPPIKTEGYLQVKQLFEELMLPDIKEDFDLTPFNLREPDLIKFEDETTPRLIPVIENILLDIPTISQSKASKPINHTASKGYSGFMKALERYELTTGDRMDDVKRRTLARFAYLESNYNPHATNNVSSACGYFGMIKAGRSDLGTKEQYLNNTNLQFAAASRLYDQNRRLMQPYYNKGRLLGLSDFLIMYGCWFLPKGIISWILNGGKDNGFKDGLGSSMTSILRKAGRLS